MIVLLVDDDLDLLEMIPELIEDYNWIMVSNYEDALKVLETQKIDVAVIDSLGGKQGLQLAELCFKLGVRSICHTGGCSIVEDSNFFDAIAIKPDILSLENILSEFLRQKYVA